ncbi:secG, partial [Symbiodinium sp. KB8]
DFYDYSNENSKLDFVAYVEDMGRIYDNILQAAAALGVSDLIFFPFGMGAFLRNLHKLDGRYCQDDVGLANLRHALAKRFVQALVVAKVPFVVRLCIAPSGKGDELDANAMAFLQAILEGIHKGVGDKLMRLKPSSVEILVNADALTVAQQYANDRRTVGLVNGANRRLIGNHWFSHGARMAIDENLHRRSWRMAATAYLLNGGAEVSRRHPNALAEAVKRLGGTVQELAARSGGDVKAKIIKLFRQYDESGDGRISKAEFVKMLMRLNHQQDDSETIFKLADTNQDGFVSYHEFARAAEELSPVEDSVYTRYSGARYLQALLGVPRFQQRLIRDGAALQDDDALWFSEGMEKERPDLLLLIQPFAEPSEKDKDVLMRFAGSDNPDLLEKLLSKPLDPNLKKNGTAALCFARPACMKLLLEAQAEPNCCDRLCNTPLGEASKSGALEVVQLLLERRGQVNMCNYRAESPVLLAMQRNHVEVVRLLCRHRADANRGS